MLDVARQKQLVHHVQHEQGAHAVIRETLPGFGEGEIGEALRVAQEGSVALVRIERRSGFNRAQSPLPISRPRTANRVMPVGKKSSGERASYTCELLLRRGALFGLLLPFALRLVDDLGEATGIAAGPNRRATERAGRARRFQRFRLVGPGFAGLRRAAWTEFLRDSVAIRFRPPRANDDLVVRRAGAGIVAIDDDLADPILRESRSRKNRQSGRDCRRRAERHDEPGHGDPILPNGSAGKAAAGFPQILFDKAMAALQPARIAAVS